MGHSSTCGEPRALCYTHDSGGDVHKAPGLFISLTLVWGNTLVGCGLGCPLEVERDG